MIEENKRIAKNTIAIYLRMFISILVSLYTSRVVLQVLGISDYGIYALVGGVVMMFSFMNNALGGATSRFINYAMGLKDAEYLKKTFRTALLSHIIIALSVLILCETIGVWMLVHKLVIPEERMFAAHVILQFSIFSMCIGILQGPFTACVIAHERMGVFAYVEILIVILKLVIVYILLIVHADRLIVYSLLVCLVSVISMMIYVLYSAKKFGETSFVPLFQKDMLYPMLSFSGWRFFGCISGTFSDQGRNILLNFFGGTVLNAAAGLANTIESVIAGFAYNVMVPFRPQIITCYAEGKYARMQLLCERAFAYSNLLFLLVGIPVFAECDFLLNLWLVEVPEYTSSFVRATLMAALITNNYGFLGTIIGAAGQIRLSQLIVGICSISTILFSYPFLLYGCSPIWVYYILVIFNFLIFLANFCLIKKYIPSLSLKGLFINGFLKDVLIFVCSVVAVLMICLFMSSGLIRLMVVALFNTVIIGIGCYFCLMTDSIRKELLVKIKTWL